MPSKVPSKVQEVRRSTRTGKPREIYTDGGATAAPIKCRGTSKKGSSIVVSSTKDPKEAEVKVSEKAVSNNGPVDTEEETGTKKLVWENYSKKDLYYKWLNARNAATDLRKEKSNLEKVRIGLSKEVRALENELKEADVAYDGAAALEDQIEHTENELLEEKEKNSKIASEKKKLMDEKKNLISTMKEKYEAITSKADYDNAKALGQWKVKFTECDLKLKAKIEEVKELKQKNSALKKKVNKLKEMVFSKTKSDLQVASMEGKNEVR